MNELFDKMSDFFAARRGLLPLVGILLILLNLLVQVVLGVAGISHWLLDSNILLHVGLVVAIIGVLLIRPLE
jgi:hypothetical protein